MASKAKTSSPAELNRGNPNHDSFWKARGFRKRPKDWKQRLARGGRSLRATGQPLANEQQLKAEERALAKTNQAEDAQVEQIAHPAARKKAARDRRANQPNPGSTAWQAAQNNRICRGPHRYRGGRL